MKVPDKRWGGKLADIEEYRKLVIMDLMKTSSFANAWSIWKPIIKTKSNEFETADSVFNLGLHLTEIFKSTSNAGRSQSDLSQAGLCWEGLVCLYLNYVFTGTNAIAVRSKKSLVPDCIRDANTINYGNAQTNTENDLLVIVFPSEFNFGSAISMKGISEKLSPKLSATEVGVIQCKTNWNDNAQIPMLWDIVYRAQGFNDAGISIGRNGHKVTDYRRFSYSFVTVPSQSTEFKKDSMPVKRVAALSGGNYWGKQSASSVASNISEIFSRNFQSAFSIPIKQSIENNLTQIKSYLNLTLEN